KAIYTSADVPGIIYDVLAVNPKSLRERRADWVKVASVWGRISEFLQDEKNVDEAATIMSARVGLQAEEYKKLMSGTKFLTLEQGLKHYERGQTLTSIYHSKQVVDEFQVKYEVYKEPMKFESYLDSSITA